jgi:hypothetical protein
MDGHGWRESLLERVPAWGAFLVSLAALVGGWALAAPDAERPPFGVGLLAAVLLTPAIGRAAFLRWWRVLALVGALAATVAITARLGPLWLWLLVALAIMLPASYWLVDRVWEAPWLSAEADLDE